MFPVSRRGIRPRIALLSTAAMLPLCFVPVAHAQESSREEIVVTAPTVLPTTAQTVTTVDQLEFKNSPAFSIGQVLQYSPGVTIKQGNGPRDVGISIRGSNDRNGFGIRNMQVLEDGFAVTQPDGLSRSDLADPHAYAGIDVYQGPSSSRFGNYATGGALNFRTRSGSDIDGFELGADGGSFGYFNTYVTLGHGNETFEYAIFGSHVRGEGFIANGGFNTTTENILARYSPTETDSFTVKIINNDLDTRLPIRLSLNQFRLNPFQNGCDIANAAATAAGCASVNLFTNGRSGATVAQSAAQAGLGRTDRRTIAGLRWEHALDDAATWRTTFVFDNKDISQPTGATAALGTTPAYNIRSDVTREGTLFGLTTTHEGGLFFNNADLESLTYNIVPGGNARLGDLSAQYTGHHSNLGGRLREEVELAPEWTLVAGVGVEYTDLKADNIAYVYAASGAVTRNLLNVQRNFLNAAYEVALRYQPSTEWEIHSRFGTAYGTPQASNLFVTPLGVPGNNTQIEAQTNRGIDLGVEWTPLGAVKAGITGFYEFFDNELVSQSPGAGLQAYTFNAPSSEHRGVEIHADWQSLSGWRLRAAYTYNDQLYTSYVERLSAGTRSAAFDRAGNTIPGVQPNFLSARAGYDQPDGWLAGLGGFVEFNWRGAFFADNANLLEAPSYRLVNLNLHYEAGNPVSWLKGVTLFLEVQNLFDTVYAASANNISDSLNAATGRQNPGANVAAATGSIYAGAPRTVTGGMRVRF